MAATARIALAVLLCAPAAALRAQEPVEVRAYLDRAAVTVDGLFALSVEVSGAGGTDEEPDLPDLSAFADYVGVHTRTSRQFVNGRSSTSLTRVYRFRAAAEGVHTIGPVRVRVGGEDHETAPLPIRITAAGSTPRPGVPDRSRSGSAVGSADLFVEASVSTREPWVNEPVIVEYRLFTRVDIESYRLTGLPGAAGFWVEELPVPRLPRMEREVRGGVQYATTVIRRSALFPTGAGPRTIEPLEIEADVRTRAGGFFGDPFGGFFGRAMPVPARSEPIAIEARPLPAEDRPDAFSGLVGRLNVTASVDAASAAANEALTFRLELRGAGNLRTLPAPEVAFPPDFDVYPPEVEEAFDATGEGLSGVRSYAYVLVPRVPGSHVVPPVEVAYFDAPSGRYAVAASDPVTLAVTGAAAASDPGPAGVGRAPAAASRQDIRFIRVRSSAFAPIDRQLFRSALFWTLAVAPVLGAAGAFAVRRRRERLEGNVAYARRRRAARLARDRLAQARSLRAPERRHAFVAGVSQALLGFLGDSLNVAEAGLVRDDIRRELGARGVPDEVTERYVACLDRCDQQRFAPPAAGNDDDGRTAALVEEAERAMTALGQALRS